MNRLWQALIERFGTRTVVLAIVASLVVVGGGTAAGLWLTAGTPSYRITAQFVATPGLYPDNRVDVLGVPTGHVISVTPKAGYVEVLISLPNRVKVPASAQAVLMAPNPVSDRFVELTPPYTDGATLAPGATIPMSRTVVPLELDQIYDSVDKLSQNLGPSGANSNGDLSNVLHAFAQLADGRGADVHTAITSIAAALPALTAHPGQLASLISGLDSITHTIAAHDSTVEGLYGDLANATAQLANDRQSIAAAATNLQQGLAAIATFLRSNQSALSGSIHNLTTAVGAVMAEQQSLINTFDLAPLGFQNFNRAIEPNADCISATGAPKTCTEIWGRLDLTSDVSDLLTRYCGSIADSFLAIVAQNAGLGSAGARETACGAQLGAVQNRPGPANSPKTPDLDLAHYLSGQGTTR